MGEEWVVGQPMTYGSPVNGNGLVKGLGWADSVDETLTPTVALVVDCLLRRPGSLGGLDGTYAGEDGGSRGESSFGEGDLDKRSLDRPCPRRPSAAREV